MTYLHWPEELPGEKSQYSGWFQPASNICLDFHGSPAEAALTVFSDGNHHMALRDCLDLFEQQNKDVTGIFYATTPPGPIVKMLEEGGLLMGNLIIRATPHVFISPPEILDTLVQKGFMTEHTPFVRNLGNVLLVAKENPKNILGAADLCRRDIRLFLSNPDTEKASFMAYSSSLDNLVLEQTGRPDFTEAKVAGGEVLFGSRIHHREAPQAVADGSADAAMVFYHLALRYIRIFPDLFDIIPCGGSVEAPDPLPGNIIGKTSVGLIGDGGLWGKKLISFLGSKKAMEIYESHGLRPINTSAE